MNTETLAGHSPTISSADWLAMVKTARSWESEIICCPFVNQTGFAPTNVFQPAMVHATMANSIPSQSLIAGNVLSAVYKWSGQIVSRILYTDGLKADWFVSSYTEDLFESIQPVTSRSSPWATCCRCWDIQSRDMISCFKSCIADWVKLNDRITVEQIQLSFF